MMPFDTSQEIFSLGFRFAAVRVGCAASTLPTSASRCKPLKLILTQFPASVCVACWTDTVATVLFSISVQAVPHQHIGRSSLDLAQANTNAEMFDCGKKVTVSHTVTRTTSSIDVMPCFTLSQPSARKLVMPSFSACCWISRAVLPVAIIDSMVSLTPMTCCTATRPW